MQKFILAFLLPLSIWAGGISYEYIEENGHSIHLLFVDKDSVELSLENGNESFIGLENLSSIAQRLGISYGVNGGFFRGAPFLGGPAGILKIRGQQFSSTDRSRGAFGFSSDGKVLLIDRLDSEITLTDMTTTFSVHGINMPRKEGWAVLYTPSFGTHTPKQERARLEISINNAGLATLNANPSQNEIPEGGMVYSIDSAFDGPIPEEGVSLYFSQRLLPQFHPENQELWESLDNILGATPVLVIDGEIPEDFNDEKVISPFLYNNFPRTAIGLLNDKKTIVFAVIKEEDNENGPGMPIADWAEFMLSLGCEHALNLCGGNSSTMYMDKPLVKERTVGNVLLIKEKDS